MADSFGPRAADAIARGMGSWAFIIAQTVLVLVWVAFNLATVLAHWDPYPFILLNLLFSTQAAYAAPLILLSQNRTAERDRIKAEHDFDVNVLSLRTLAELLGDVHDLEAQRRLRKQIDALLGTDPQEPGPRAEEAV